jgi:hypothetical protein
MLVALLACAAPYAPLFAAAFLLYLGAFLVGQTFLSFQWDILLLETGALAVLLAPLSPLTRARAPSRPAVLALHWCLFKLMLMSGVVKLQARCDTWLSLTALHYHYATQCLPTPGAWWAHQLPNALQKLSVAATYVIEMPAAALFLAPWPQARALGGALNVVLMLAIVATGNYTFFNVPPPSRHTSARTRTFFSQSPQELDSPERRFPDTRTAAL